MRNIAVLGSTGSIGTQTLSVAAQLDIPVMCLTANSNAALLEQQARHFRPKVVALRDERAARDLKMALSDTQIQVLSGEEGVAQAAAMSGAEIAVVAIMGLAALWPTIASIQAGMDIALANKESLVCAGNIVFAEAEKHNVTIIPVDSEHSAIFQCLQANGEGRAVDKILLTASGGPFFGMPFSRLENVTVEEALNHPNWNMGSKITIDSATMMNKGLELIEAMRLFKVRENDVNIIVHRESIVHSAVQFTDGSVIAQMSVPDMRLPIEYALLYPRRGEAVIEKLDLFKIGNLSFYPPDEAAFPCLSLARAAARRGNGAETTLNGANEVAVELFLKGKIGFNDIFRRVSHALERHSDVINPTIKDILEIDSIARKYAAE